MKGELKRARGGAKYSRFHGAISDLNFVDYAVNGTHANDEDNEEENEAVVARKMLLHESLNGERQEMDGYAVP